MVYFCAPNYSTFNTHREGPRTKWLISWSWPIQTGVFFPWKKTHTECIKSKKGEHLCIYIYMNHIRCHWGFIRLVLRCFFLVYYRKPWCFHPIFWGFSCRFFSFIQVMEMIQTPAILMGESSYWIFLWQHQKKIPMENHHL